MFRGPTLVPGGSPLPVGELQELSKPWTVSWQWMESWRVDGVDGSGFWGTQEAPWEKMKLGGGLKHFYFHPYLGKISHLTIIFFRYIVKCQPSSAIGWFGKCTFEGNRCENE